MWGHLYDEKYLSLIRKLGIPVINISMDDRLSHLWGYKDGIRLGSVGLCPFVDMVLTTSPETCLYYTIESTPALYFPLASDANLYHFDSYSKRDIDVLFVGNKYGIREELIEYLIKKGVSVLSYGKGWDNGFASANESIALSKRAKIILGVGTVGYSKDVYTLKLRDFDALMSGALYVTHRNRDLIELFNEGTEIECYTSFAELHSKITYYLKNENDRLMIASSGQEKAKKLHNWDYRLSQTFKELGLIG
jgi:spore maturation protein CgeB